jgi:hypothetical protein
MFVDLCLFVLLSFFRLAIMLSVLRFTDSDYPFGVFKLFLKLFLELYSFYSDNIGKTFKGILQMM